MSMLLSLSLAFAQEECDVVNLSKTIETTTGDEAAVAFSALAQCDAERAGRFAKTTIITFLPSEEGYDAALQAMKIDQEEYVVEWMNQRLEASEQKQLLRKLGEVCQKEDKIQEFFIDRAANHSAIWKHRYYQYFNSLSNPFRKSDEATELGTDQGRSQYFSVMSAYARNLQIDALP